MLCQALKISEKERFSDLFVIFFYKLSVVKLTAFEVSQT